MNPMQEALYEFHEKFHCYASRAPHIIDNDTRELRKSLMLEELSELTDAMYERDLIKIADGLADLLYVVFGTAVSYGLDMQPLFDEVHRSNMTKVGEDGEVRYREDGKVIKPPTYSKADLAPIIAKMYFKIF